MGYGRAGFYSYDFLDNDGNPSADRILPEYQDLMVGDLVPLDERGSVIVVKLEHAKHLLLAYSERFTWAWELSEVGQNQSRLVTRIRHDMDSVVMSFMWDTFEFVMMRKCLLGIKSRAESLKGASAGGFIAPCEILPEVQIMEGSSTRFSGQQDLGCVILFFHNFECIRFSVVLYQCKKSQNCS